MAIIGLETERVNPPHEPETTFILRKALSPYECERARSQSAFNSMDRMLESIGPEGFQTVIRALNEGQSAEQIQRSVGPRALPGEVEVGNVADLPDEDADDESDVIVGDVADLAPEDADERDQYDLDSAAKRLVKAWSYRDSKGRKVKVTVEHIRMLDLKTRTWLHDKTWAAMQPSMANGARQGNL